MHSAEPRPMGPGFVAEADFESQVRRSARAVSRSELSCLSPSTSLFRLGACTVRFPKGAAARQTWLDCSVGRAASARTAPCVATGRPVSTLGLGPSLPPTPSPAPASPARQPLTRRLRPSARRCLHPHGEGRSGFWVQGYSGLRVEE